MQKRWKEENYNQIGLQKMLSSVVLEVNKKVSAIKTDQLGIIGAFHQALIKRLNLSEEGIEMTLALSGQWELLINP
jgi:phenylalanyl-tRNA synthetase beta subunit